MECLVGAGPNMRHQEQAQMAERNGSRNSLGPQGSPQVRMGSTDRHENSPTANDPAIGVSSARSVPIAARSGSYSAGGANENRTGDLSPGSQAMEITSPVGRLKETRVAPLVPNRGLLLPNRPTTAEVRSEEGDGRKSLRVLRCRQVRSPQPAVRFRPSLASLQPLLRV